MGEFSIAIPLGLEPSLAHFHRQLAAVGKPLPKTFLLSPALKVLVRLIVELLMILD